MEGIPTPTRAGQPCSTQTLTPAASGSRATRWGPCHCAIGVAAVARLVTGLTASPTPATRPSGPPPALRRARTCWGPRVLVMVPPAGRRSRLRGAPEPERAAPDTASVPVTDVPDDDVPAADVPAVADVPAAGVPAASVAPAVPVDATPPASPSPKGPRGSVLSPHMTVAINSGVPDPWVLRFDGTCRRNPGSGGAGAALFAPSDTVV
ncbi:unnamed protein product [Peronospora belbahrii]|uniref:Uncharacterized protein n=1 Tax=Peronospora belbahrii TaxID=622444 RepID=A0ABN8D0V9_9STRA|nr:unnamed protein product [Peronospora belbahrii]